MAEKRVKDTEIRQWKAIVQLTAGIPGVRKLNRSTADLELVEARDREGLTAGERARLTTAINLYRHAHVTHGLTARDRTILIRGVADYWGVST